MIMMIKFSIDHAKYFCFKITLSLLRDKVQNQEYLFEKSLFKLFQSLMQRFLMDFFPYIFLFVFVKKEYLKDSVLLI